jgi:hypothetical protein
MTQHFIICYFWTFKNLFIYLVFTVHYAKRETQWGETLTLPGFDSVLCCGFDSVR